MRTANLSVTFLFLLLGLTSSLFSQKQKLFVELGQNQSISCGDTVKLDARVSNWISYDLEQVPNYLSFNQVHFCSPQKGFIASNQGYLFKTLDGGNNWNSINISNLSGINQIYFVDEQTGFLTSFSNYYRTSDGGESWKLFNFSHYITAFCFENANVGYLSANSHFMKTTDGGITWTDINTNMPAGFNKMILIDGNIIGSSNNGLYRSGDGGLNWNRVSSAPSADICFNKSGGLFSVSNGGLIFQSVDSGKIWKEIFSSNNKYFSSIAFNSKDTGYVVGNFSTLMETTDGGVTWKAAEVAPGNYTKVFASQGMKMVIGESKKVLRWNRLGDLQFKWSENNTAVGKSSPQLITVPYSKTNYKLEVLNGSLTGTDSVTVDIDFKVNVGQDKSVICGDSVLLTANLFEFWPLSTNVDEDLIFNFFVNDSTGFAVGTSIYKTTNKGKTWRRINTLYYGQLTGICFIDPMTGFVCGYNGTILVTKDGGETWMRATSGVTEHLNGVYFINSTTGFAYGNNSVIYITTNGGTNWQLASAQMLSPLLTMAFASSTTGFAAGDNGLLLKTTNGGSSWNKIDIGPVGDIVSMTFYDKMNGIMVGTNGLILKTSDGGINWEKISSSSYRTFSSVNYINKNEVLAFGDEIIYSNDGGNTWIKLVTPQKQYIFSAFYINNLLYTVGRAGEMMYYYPNQNVVYGWKASSGEINSTSRHFYVKPKTSTNYYLTVTSNKGCVARDTIKVNIKELSIRSFAHRNKVTCSDSTVLFCDPWYKVSLVNSSSNSAISYINEDNIVHFNNYYLYKTSNGGQSWQNTYLKTSLKSASFYHSQIGFGVGYNGNLYKTSDGGKNWNDVNAGSGFQFVLFINEFLGFVVGDSGKIKRTIDGGNQWQSLNTGINQKLINLECVDENFLIAKSESGNYIITNNNGNNWYLVAHPVNDKIATLCMINTNEGYAFGKGKFFYSTNDGGKSWEKGHTSYYNFISLFFIDKDKGYGIDSNYKIYETIDGGKNWTMSRGFSKSYIRFISISPKLVVAISNAYEFKIYQRNRLKNFSWTSLNGFSSTNPYFSYVSPKQESVYYLKAYTDGGCYASDSCIVQSDPLKISAGKDLEVWPGDSVRLFASVANGNGNWTIVQTAFKKTQFIDYQTGFASTASGNIYKTTNGSKSWDSIAKIDYLRDFYFIDKFTGYALGYNFYKTIDGGKSWTPNNLEYNLYSAKFYFVSKKRGYIITGGNFYLETNDFGRTWQKTEFNTDYHISKLLYISDSLGYILLNNKNFYLVTKDAGKTWQTQVFTSANVNPKAIFFTDSLNGVIGDNQIHRTTDGGKKWTQLPNPTGSYIEDIFFLNQKNGYAFSSGKLIKTSDGGATWVLEPDFDFGYGFGKIEFPDANHGYICSENGKFGIYSEPLKVNYNWNPAEIFNDPASDIQVIKAVKSLELILSAKASHGCSATDTIRITLKDISKMTALESINIQETLVTMDIGQSQQLTVNCLPQNAYNNEVFFTSTDTSKVMVDGNGKITSKKGGQATIFAKSADGKIWDNCVVNVNYALEGLYLYPEVSGVEVGGKLMLYIEFYPNVVLSDDFTVRVENPAYIQAIDKGRDFITITGLQIGYSNIVVTSKDGKYSSMATIYVGPRLHKIDITEEELTVEANKMKKLNFTYSPTDIPRDFFIWLSSDTSIVSVDSLGIIRTKRPGEAAVGCFYIFNFYNYDTCLIHVTEPMVPKENPIYPNPCGSFINVESGDYIDHIDQVTIYNLKGEMVLRKKILAPKARINVGNLSKGNYILEYTILNSGNRFKYMFVKM